MKQASLIWLSSLCQIIGIHTSDQKKAPKGKLLLHTSVSRQHTLLLHTSVTLLLHTSASRQHTSEAGGSRWACDLQETPTHTWGVGFTYCHAPSDVHAQSAPQVRMCPGSRSETHLRSVCVQAVDQRRTSGPYVSRQ